MGSRSPSGVRRLVFNSANTVAVDERHVKLSPIEYDLLKALAESYPYPVSCRRLLSYVWGQHAIGRTSYVKLYVYYLRTKIERMPSSPEVILTEWGHGYRLAVPPTFL